jgi:predicted transcriptional regulator
MNDIWDKIAKIKRGKNRIKIFISIEQPIMPSDLVKQIFGKPSNTYFNIVSRALNELAKEGLVRVKNPKERTGRLYELTPLGKKVHEKIKLTYLRQKFTGKE